MQFWCDSGYTQPVKLYYHLKEIGSAAEWDSDPQNFTLDKSLGLRTEHFEKKRVYVIFLK